MLTNPEQLHQIMELTVDISAYGDRAPHWLHIALLRQYFFSLKENEFDDSENKKREGMRCSEKACHTPYLLTEHLDFVLGDRLELHELLNLPIENRDVLIAQYIHHHCGHLTLFKYLYY